MTTGIERGNSDDTETWRGAIATGTTLAVGTNATIAGTLGVTGATTFTGAITVAGCTLLRKKSIAFTTASQLAGYTTVATNTGWSIPAGATVQRCWVLVNTKDTGSITLNVGTASSNYYDFLNALPIGSGCTDGTLYTGYPVTTGGTNIGQKLSANYVGTNLADYTAPVDNSTPAQCTGGFFIQKPFYTATDLPLYIKCSGTCAATTKITLFIEYVI